MEGKKDTILNAAIGPCTPDREGSPVGVVRLDAETAHFGIGRLLKDHLNGTDPEAWAKIRGRIDYTYRGLDAALDPLERATGFSREIRQEIAKGRKLFFKPNLVSMACIEPQTHSPDRGATATLSWAFMAALMRWFHDRMGVRYFEMAIGEAATTMSSVAAVCTMMHPEGKRVTTEAAIEGKIGDFYCGWGFYFARKYLKDSLPPEADSQDDPMLGYEESLSGTYIPPGFAMDKLMVYDLNRIVDNPSKGRDVDVPDGVHFRTITLHKAIVGGEPGDPEDRRAYPGCILVNVPRLKVHNVTLLTAAIKNLGIGLYPMESARTEAGYDYGLPRTGISGIKGGVPHQVWIPEMDDRGFPKRDAEGKYIVTKTGGITAAMVDIIQAVRSQGIPMIHVVDAVEATNLDHQSVLPGVPVPEGLIFAGTDPVAVDMAAARYLFSNISMREAKETGISDHSGGFFSQRVPVPILEGGQITTRSGYDCPINRDFVAIHAEQRGLGRRKYYVAGRDVVADRPLISVQGRMGTVNGDRFEELVTKELYYDVFKFPWDMQRTFLNYLEASDRVGKGASRKQEFLDAFDETGKGAPSYEEFGKKGDSGARLHWAGYSNSLSGTERLGHLKGVFMARSAGIKGAFPEWNAHGHHYLRETFWGSIVLMAYRLSQAKEESPDPFVPGLVWGKGKWPSFEYAAHRQIASGLYGPGYPKKAGPAGIYGFAFMYADRSRNGGRYSGDFRARPTPGGMEAYFADVAAGAKPLDFTVYVPKGFETVGGKPVPNVVVTDDPEKVITASFLGGKEVWSALGSGLEI